MTTHFLHSYSQLLIKTCHRRGALAMGGMAAQIPIKNDPAANDAAIAKVRADKQREADDGHDGTWVAHPGLVPIAMEVFDRADAQAQPAAPQLRRRRRDGSGPAEGPGRHDHRGRAAQQRRRVASSTWRAWLGGHGCVPIYNLMEDAATAEISRAQVWQWIRHPNGGWTTAARSRSSCSGRSPARNSRRLRAEVGEAATPPASSNGRRSSSTRSARPRLREFLTLPAYRAID